MKQILRNIGIGFVALFASANVNAQCTTITCPGDTTIARDAGVCGAVFNYTTPIGTDSCAQTGNVLFVCDGNNTTATEIPAELNAAGYNVTEVYDDYIGGENATLQAAGLDQYDVIYWHASGSGSGAAHNASTFDNLTPYIVGGGAIFITGYDLIASPIDQEMIEFLGGTSSTDGGTSGTETVVGTNSLTTGVTNIDGLVLNASADHDGLNGLQPGTIGVASSGTSHGWTIRTLGAGEIAMVSTGNYQGQTWTYWNTPGSGYQEALVNFAFNHSTSCTGNVLFVCDGDNTTAMEIPAELNAAGYNVTEVYNDYSAGDNALLQAAGLNEYDVIYWHASGDAGYGAIHNAATFTNLTAYVNAGGSVFVTGYDMIASPMDPELIAFLGGTSSTDGGMAGTETLVGINSLTTGVTNTVGLVLNANGDHDGLDGLQTGTVGVVTGSGGSHGWTIRTLGAGEIAMVSSANQAGQTWAYWNTPGSGYQEALVNFAFNHSCLPVGSPVTTMTAGLADGAFFPIGTTTVTYEVVDGQGNNPQSCSFDVTVLSGIDVSTTLAADNITISANNTNGTYQWIDCSDNSIIAGETGVDFTPTNSGDYAVVITEDGCSDTSACQSIGFAGVDYLDINALVLYPNPTNGVLNINFEGEVKSIAVVDMLGRVMNLPVSNNEKTVDGTSLSEGKYMIRIVTESNQVLVKEFVVLK